MYCLMQNTNPSYVFNCLILSKEIWTDWQKADCDKYGQKLWKNIKFFCDIADGQMPWVKKADEKFIKEHA